MITLNNVIKNLNNIADSHSQINSFFFGEMYDFASSGATEYPAMAVELTPSVYQRGVLIQSFNIYIMDLVHKDIRDRQDVLSDTRLTCLDVVALLDRDTRYDWHINTDNITFTDFVDRFDQEVSGHWFKLDFRTPYPLDKCQVPLSSPVSVLLPTELETVIECNAYILKVQIDSDGDTFEFKLGNTISSYVNAIFDWGDNKFDVITTWNQAELTHTYDSAGTYTIRVVGAMEEVRFNNSADVTKLVELSQWGSTKVVLLSTSYRGATNLQITATDTPNIDTVTDMTFAFQNNTVNNPDVKNWPAGNITSMGNSFINCTVANPDITGSGWQDAQIVTWDNAFKNSAFNRDLTVLDFTATISMDGAFDNSALSTDNYDNLLLALDRDNVSNCPIGAAGINFTTAVSGTARTNLVGRGCTITDAGGV